MLSRATIGLAFGGLLALAACGGPPLAIRQFGGPTMGSTYEVKYAADAPVARVQAVVAEELAAFDAAFSNWRPGTEIAKVNAHASLAPLPVSARFGAVLQTALDVAVATEGAFDPTVKPLCDVYRAAKKDPAHHLDAQALAAAKPRVGYTLVKLVDGAVVKARPDVQLDLDGLVAGAACDAIAVRLAAIGVGSFYLQVTGEVLCRGVKPDGEPWRIGVVDPASDATGGETAIRSLPLRDQALCTSGDYRNAFVSDGKLVHHVFDPRTGESAHTGVVSASVLAPSAAIADALGTALLVLGVDETKRLWPAMQKLGAAGALFLLPNDDRTFREVEITWPKDDS